MKESEIKIKISLDANKVPEQIYWTAEDAGEVNQKSEAILMSLWDAEKQNSLRIDLWTKDMRMNDMFIMYHQTLMGMASSLEKATGEDKLAGALRDYCGFFAEQTKILTALF